MYSVMFVKKIIFLTFLENFESLIFFFFFFIIVGRKEFVRSIEK